MKKKQSVLSALDRRAKKNARHMPDSALNFSDIPELTDNELSRARRVGRPYSKHETKQLIAIRIAPYLLKKLRGLASKKDTPYQTFIHHLLEAAVRNAA